MPELRPHDPRLVARQIATELGLTGPSDVDLDRIAKAKSIEIELGDLDGAMASVMRIGNTVRIRVSARLLDLGARRFSIAHELGHLWLGHEIADRDARDVIERLCTPLRATRKPLERNASVFATEFLMQEAWVKPYCMGEQVTLAPVRAIADAFTCSMLASANRLVELSPRRCAVVCCELGRVRWFKRSPTFPAWIPKGRRIDPASIAYEYHERGVIDPHARAMNATIWLPPHRVDGSFVEIVEHAIVIPELGVVASLLWIPERDAGHLDLAA